MSELRERLETLFTKHHHCYEPCQDVLDALVAMWPQPSREGLEKLLAPFQWYVPCHCPTPPCTCGTHELDKDGMVDRLLAWATGEPRRGWCEHWSYRPELPHRWYRTEGSQKMMVPLTEMNFCHVCAAPRPEAS